MDWLDGELQASYDNSPFGRAGEYGVSSDDLNDKTADLLTKGQRRRLVVNENYKLIGTQSPSE